MPKPLKLVAREALPEDLPTLFDLCKKAWAGLGLHFIDDKNRFVKWATRARVIVLYDGQGMASAEAASLIETDRGPGFRIDILVVDPDRKNTLMLLDAIVLYGCNIAASEGRLIVESWDPKASGTAYGRDLIGMAAEDVGPRINQVSDLDTVARCIFARRPEWRPSP